MKCNGFARVFWEHEERFNSYIFDYCNYLLQIFARIAHLGELIPYKDSVVGSSPTSGTSTICVILYGLWDCKGWSSVLHTENQVGSIPTRSSVVI